MKKYDKPLDKGPIPTRYRFLKRLEKLEELQVSIEDKKRIVRIGKGLANTYGEEGRIYFHRIWRSGDNYRYNADVADSQYSKCLKLKNEAGMGSVFHELNIILDDVIA